MNFSVAILLLKMVGKKATFWHIMLHYFKKGKNSTEVQKKTYAIYGKGAVTDRMCQKWFVKFQGSFSVDSPPWLGLTVEVDSSQIETLRTMNIILLRRQPAYLNQALTIICTSLVMFISLMFGSHIR